MKFKKQIHLNRRAFNLFAAKENKHHSHHLKEGQVSVADMVKGNLGVDPGVVLLGALPPVVDHAGQQSLAVAK